MSTEIVPFTAALKAQFEEWSRIGGGLYFNANGTAGAEDLELPSGIYTVKILTSPIRTFSDVTIKPEETTRVSAAGKD